MHLNIFHTCIMVLVIGIIVGFVLTYRKCTNSKKIVYVLTSIGVIVYSGISTLYVGLCEEFFWTFVVYFASIALGFLIFSTICEQRKIKKNRCVYYSKESSVAECKSFTEKYISDDFLRLMVFLYFLYIVVQFIYPENKLSNLFHIDLSLTEAFEKRGEERGNAIYQVFYYINLATKPFYFIYLGRMMKKGKYFQAIFLYVSYSYLNIALYQYVARSGALAELLFLMMMMIPIYKKELKFRKVIGVFVKFGTGFIFLIPILLAYETFRLGGAFDVGFSLDSVYELIYKETDYGKRFAYCAENQFSELTKDYLIWLLTLPLPSALFTFKEDLLLVNTYFSECVLGMKSTEPGFYFLLPSILGEALFVCGKKFFWLHGIFFGGFLSVFCSMLEKNNELYLLLIYFSTQFLLIGRGGIGSAIPQAVNIMVMYLLVNLFYRIFVGKRRLRLKKNRG